MFWQSENLLFSVKISVTFLKNIVGYLFQVHPQAPFVCSIHDIHSIDIEEHGTRRFNGYQNFLLKKFPARNDYP